MIWTIAEYLVDLNLGRSSRVLIIREIEGKQKKQKGENSQNLARVLPGQPSWDAQNID
jgi:hypothetical protein